ncbi:MAG: SWIM zinc finger family protein [Acidimicrobiales bacterium]
MRRASRSGGDWWQQPRRLPGPSAPRAKGRRPFGTSWWGNAWIEALEQRARLDSNRLPRGRTYARTGAVGPITLSPGHIEAEVQGSRRQPYEVSVRVLCFSEEQWGKVLDAMAAEIGHTAALLDGELPAGVDQDVRSVGLDLLPGPGELQPRCSCPDWADPCKHSAAVCYLVADLLDEDPFGVLLLRGHGREEVLAALRQRRHAGSGSPAGTGSPSGLLADEGVPARQAWAAPDAGRLSSQPVPPSPPSRPGHPTVLAADPPPGAGVDAAALRALAADAAQRALALARGGRATGLELSRREDLARRAAAMIGGSASSGPGRAEGDGGLAGAPPGDLSALAKRAGLRGRDLLRDALAYRYGGVAGLAVLDEVWDPAPDVVAAGVALLAATSSSGRAPSTRHNRVTALDRQLRLALDGRWYPFRKDRSGQWSPDGPGVAASAGDGDLGQLDDEDSG